MIVCSCNALSDRDVRSTVRAERPSSISQVYDRLGCSARCGRCAHTIHRLVDETLANARAASCKGCDRSCNLDHRPSHPVDLTTQSPNKNSLAGREATAPTIQCPLAAT